MPGGRSWPTNRTRTSKGSSSVRSQAPDPPRGKSRRTWNVQSCEFGCHANGGKWTLLVWFAQAVPQESGSRKHSRWSSAKKVGLSIGGHRQFRTRRNAGWARHSRSCGCASVQRMRRGDVHCCHKYSLHCVRSLRAVCVFRIVFLVRSVCPKKYISDATR
jgi:hypothetical protein